MGSRLGTTREGSLPQVKLAMLIKWSILQDSAIKKKSGKYKNFCKSDTLEGMLLLRASKV